MHYIFVYQCITIILSIGVHAPTVYCVDVNKNQIVMENIADAITVKEYIKSSPSQQNLEDLASTIGTTVGKLHTQNIIHGDLTTSNLLIRNENVSSVTVIDFGLSYINSSPEDKGVDLYVLERALISTHPNTEYLFQIMLNSYCKTNKRDGKETIKKYEEVRLRGRKRLMVG